MFFFFFPHGMFSNSINIILRRNTKLRSICTPCYHVKPRSCWILNKSPCLLFNSKVLCSHSDWVWDTDKIIMLLNLSLKRVLHPWALSLKTLYIFSKNKAIFDKVSYWSQSEMFQGTQKSQFYFSKGHCWEITVKNVRKSIFSMFWTINQ